MQSAFILVLFTMSIVVVTDKSCAQLTLQRVSPRASVSQTIDINDVTIDYLPS